MKLQEMRNNWALITGASTGIGREFAIKLAAAGMNLVLVARREHLLNALALELTKRFNIQALPVSADLTLDDALSKIKSCLEPKGIQVRLLVNNAAMARWGNFELTSFKDYEKIITLNVLTMVSFCHHFFQDLRSFPTSAIINVSSPAAFNPIPYMAVYAASKAFASSFSQALYGEWEKYGILVQTLMPGPTETDLGKAAAAYSKFFKDMRPAEEVVKTALDHLSRNSPLVITARKTFNQRLFTTIFPTKFVIKTLARLFQPPSSN
jgi:hypothetical protein